jgi:hypothetical protein
VIIPVVPNLGVTQKIRPGCVPGEVEAALSPQRQ